MLCVGMPRKLRITDEADPRESHSEFMSSMESGCITTLIQTCERSKPPSRIMRSDIYWFAEICNSQCLSHFAASFIASRAEVSIVKGVNDLKCVL